MVIGRKILSKFAPVAFLKASMMRALMQPGVGYNMWNHFEKSGSKIVVISLLILSRDCRLICSVGKLIVVA